jgi:hypothetical protein
MMRIKLDDVPQVLVALKKFDGVPAGADVRTAFRAVGLNLKIDTKGDIVGLKPADVTTEQMTKVCEMLDEFVYFGTKIELTVEGKKFTWEFKKPRPEQETVEETGDENVTVTTTDKPAKKGTGRGKSQA